MIQDQLRNKRFLMIFLFVMILIFMLDSLRNLYASTLPDHRDLLSQSIVPLNGLNDSTALIKYIDEIPYVLIGDSTHGSYEFYQQRINISKHLITEKNFKLIVLEGDLPNVYWLNQYVQSLSPISAMQALNVTNPQGAWLWGNVAMLNFIRWLKKHNDQLPEGEQKVRLHGLDIYSFHRSRREVIHYLQNFSSEAAEQAHQRYSCFNRFNNNLHQYGKAVAENPSMSCAMAVIEQFEDFARCHFPCPEKYPSVDEEAFFYAQENARILKNIEKSFRIQYRTGDDTNSWNNRDLHMMESLLAVLDYMKQPKTIVWAHNSHLGDARATQMIQSHQLNVGQLIRQTFGQNVFSIGMLTYKGLVSAADDWNSQAEIKVLLNAHPASNEGLFHSLGVSHFMLYLHQSLELKNFLNATRLQRHVGVVYRPQDEMDSHYTKTHLSDQFDAIIYIDTTTPVIDLNTR